MSTPDPLIVEPQSAPQRPVWIIFAAFIVIWLAVCAAAFTFMMGWWP